MFQAPPWFRIVAEKVQLPDGRVIEDFHRIENRDYAVIFPLVAPGEALCIWHYKHGPQRETLAVPAGYVEPGEAPLAAAKRELREETGLEAASWTALGSFTVDGNRDCGKAHVFLARDTRKVAEPDSDDLEENRLETLKLDALRRHLRDGSVATLGAAAAISLGLGALDAESAHRR